MAPHPSAPQLDHPAVRLPPPLIYLALFALGLLLDRLLPLASLATTPTRVAGLLLIVGGAALALASLAQFRRSRTSVLPDRPATALLTAGPYRRTRNPIYLSMLGIYVGAALWFDVLWALLLAPLVLLTVQRLVIEQEERYLERRFGDAFRQYRARVRRWI